MDSTDNKLYPDILRFVFTLNEEVTETFRGFRPVPANSRLLAFDLLTLAGQVVEVMLTLHPTPVDGQYDVWAQISHAEFDGQLRATLQIEGVKFSATMADDMFKFAGIPLGEISRGNTLKPLGVTFQIHLQ